MKTPKALKDAQNLVEESLSFLDVMWVRILLIVLVVLYIAGGVPLLTSEVAGIFQHPVVKVLFVLLILYIGFKDLPLALLLALAFVLSLQMGYKYQLGAQLGAGPVQVGAHVGATKAGLGAGGKLEVGPAKVHGEASLGNVEGMTDSKEGPEGGNYNHYFDCVKDCAENDLGKGPLDSPCKAVGVWKDELNAQGLNCPLGYSGSKDGAPF